MNIRVAEVVLCKGKVSRNEIKVLKFRFKSSAKLFVEKSTIIEETFDNYPGYVNKSSETECKINRQRVNNDY